MSRNAENFSMEEALALITHHFLEQDGIIAQVERGEKIDEARLQGLQGALQRVHVEWVAEDLVAKEQVRLLWNVSPRLEKCLLLYPQREAEIQSLIATLGMWIERIFTTPTMSEEQAIAIVSQHVIGPSFLVDVLLARRTNEAAIDEVFAAIETLTRVWKQKQEISKLAAGALITTQFMALSDWYAEEEMERLQRVKQQLNERITACLS